MASNPFNLSIKPNTGQIQRLWCRPFLTRSGPCPSHAKTRYKSWRKIIMGYPRYFSSELWWKGKFQENSKSLESSSNFQNWHTPEFGKWAVSPPRILCFARRTLSKLYRLAHLFFNMAKLTADLNHDLRTKTHLGSLRHAGDSSRIKGLMMPNLLPGGRKYSSNKHWISVEITSKLQFP